MTEAAPLYCTYHPTRETMLRCNRCEKPICMKCAVHTPTGYRCKECVHSIQRNYDNTTWIDYASGFIVTSILSAITSILVVMVSRFFWGLIILIGAPAAGALIAQAAQLALRRHRSKTLFLTTAAGVVIGVIPAVIVTLLMGNLMATIWEVVFIFIATPIVYHRVSGIIFSK